MSGWIAAGAGPIICNPELMKALRMAVRPLTKEEKFEQRVSFVYGQTKGVSKEQIRIQLIGSGSGE